MRDLKSKNRVNSSLPHQTVQTVNMLLEAGLKKPIKVKILEPIVGYCKGCGRKLKEDQIDPLKIHLKQAGFCSIKCLRKHKGEMEKQYQLH
jgi:hypothetical protein